MRCLLNYALPCLEENIYLFHMCDNGSHCVVIFIQMYLIFSSAGKSELKLKEESPKELKTGILLAIIISGLVSVVALIACIICAAKG